MGRGVDLFGHRKAPIYKLNSLRDVLNKKRPRGLELAP